MKLNISFWVKLSFFNLLLVATLGLLMRYKILFEFPFLDQKNIQHSHSHFAFAGWVSQLLFTLMVYTLSKTNEGIVVEKYKKIFIANLGTAYVMLLSFILQGYGIVSIIFSTLSLLVTFWFTYVFLKDLQLVRKKMLSTIWFKAALFFSIISSLGTVLLAIMMATKNVHQNLYLSSVYYYLHFQYNGWFWFACIGLFLSQFKVTEKTAQLNNAIFKLFFISCIPAFLLSILWLKIPQWLYAIAIVAAFLQLIAWWKFCLQLLPQLKTKFFTKPFYKKFYWILLFCISLKLILQLGSTIPTLNHLVFGFRPIIIAYLHLVLLAIISLFLLTFTFDKKLFSVTPAKELALSIFTFGIILNEILLAIQGIAAFSYIPIPYINELLFITAIVLCIGIAFLVILNRKK